MLSSRRGGLPLALSFLSPHHAWSFVITPVEAKASLTYLHVPRLNAFAPGTNAGRGAATAHGDAPRDDHANVGWTGAAVRLGRIGCGRDLGRYEGGRSGGATLGGRAGCTEKVQCITGGGSNCGATTHGRGEGSTKGGTRPFACLANGGGHVDTASHGRGEGCPEGGALSRVDASRGTAAYSCAQVCAEGGGFRQDHRGKHGADAIISKLPPKPTIEHEWCGLQVRGAVTASGAESAEIGGEPVDVAAGRRAKGGAQQGQGRGRPDWQGHACADRGCDRGAEQRKP